MKKIYIISCIAIMITAGIAFSKTHTVAYAKTAPNNCRWVKIAYSECVKGCGGIGGASCWENCSKQMRKDQCYCQAAKMGGDASWCNNVGD